MLIRHSLTPRSGSVTSFLMLFAWICGMLFGMLSAIRADFHSVMLAVSFNRLSIVCHILILCVPLLISYILFRLSRLYLILPFIFGESYIYFFCKFGFRLTFGATGWLLSELAFFSENILVCVLLFFWNLQDIEGRRLDCTAVTCVILLFIIGIIDYYAISPMVELLLNN